MSNESEAKPAEDNVPDPIAIVRADRAALQERFNMLAGQKMQIERDMEIVQREHGLRTASLKKYDPEFAKLVAQEEAAEQARRDKQAEQVAPADVPAATKDKVDATVERAIAKGRRNPRPKSA